MDASKPMLCSEKGELPEILPFDDVQVLNALPQSRVDEDHPRRQEGGQRRALGVRGEPISGFGMKKSTLGLPIEPRERRGMVVSSSFVPLSGSLAAGSTAV